MTAIANTTGFGAPQPRRDRASLKVAVLVLAAGIALGIAWMWHAGAERKAIRRLPVQERRALYERTLGTLQTPCGAESHSEALEPFCRDQAEFIVQFPECDTECTALARRHLAPIR